MKTFLDISLPVWRGLREKPVGRMEVAAFRLEHKEAGHLSLVTPLDTDRLYRSADYSFITQPPGASEWGTSLASPYIEWTVDLVKSKPRLLLEIGGGSEFVCRQLLRRLPSLERAFLIDPALTPRASDQLTVIQDFWASSTGLQNRIPLADLAVSFNCLEHVPDPKAFMYAMHVSMSDEGEAVLVLPDVERQLRTGDWNVFLHEHISYFNIHSAFKCFEESGFEILRHKSESDTGFFHLKSTHNPAKVPTQSVEFFADPEAFHSSLSQFRNEIQIALQQDGEVGFVGATNGLNSLLYLSGQFGNPRMAVYDSDESKVGLFLPALSTPIRSTADSRLTASSTVFVAAMTYFEEIRNQLVFRVGVPESVIRAVC